MYKMPPKGKKQGRLTQKDIQREQQREQEMKAK